MCEDDSRCTNCEERNEMKVKCAFWANLLKLVFFEFLKIIKQNWCKVVILVIKNVIEMKGIEIGMFSVMKLSFL